MNDLKNHYKVNFDLMYYHKIDISKFDDMFPWERDIYLGMLAKTVEEENQKRKEEAAKRRVRNKR